MTTQTTITIDSTLKPLLIWLNKYTKTTFKFGYGYNLNNTFYSLILESNITLPTQFITLEFNTAIDKYHALCHIYNCNHWPTGLKVQFISHIYNQLKDRKQLLTLFPLLQLPQTAVQLSSILNIAKCPQNIRHYATEKQLSLKQLTIFTTYSNDYLHWVYDNIITPYMPSCALLLELTESLYDIKQRYNYTLQQLSNLITINSTTTSQKTTIQLLRNIIMQHRHPTLHKHNTTIQSTINSLDLPKSIAINWDKTLENKELTITLSLKKQTDLKLIDTLHTNKQPLNQLLNKLDYD